MPDRIHSEATKSVSGLVVREGADGWEVYSPDTGSVDSLHATEAQARTWARQINEQTGLRVTTSSEVGSLPDTQEGRYGGRS